MSETIPNEIFKRAAKLCDKFPTVDFMTLAAIINAYSEQYLIVIPQEQRSEEQAELPFAKKRMRPRKRVLVLDGITLTFKCLKSIFDVYEISEEYNKRPAPTQCIKVRDVVKEEASFFKEFFYKKGKNLSAYSAYNFNGEFQTVEFS